MGRSTLDHREAAAMQVALSLVDDMDNGMEWMFTGSSSEEQVNGAAVEAPHGSEQEEDATTPHVKRPARKRRRNSRKEELVYLRAKVADLQESLDETKQRIHEARGSDYGQHELLSIWEDVAKRQQHKRYAAEKTNTTLRSMLETQMQVARQLMQFLQKQPREEDIPGMRAPRKLTRAPVDVIQMSHEDNLARMDLQYKQSDQIFTDHQEWTSQRTFRSVKLSNDDQESDVTVIEIHMTWVVPFELSLVDRVLRHQSERATLETKSTQFKTLPERDGLLVSLFAGVAQDKSGAISEVNGHVLTRSYHQDQDNTSQVVIVSELIAEPVDRGLAASSRTYAVHAQGWIRLLPYKHHGVTLKSRTTQHLTHIQWFRRCRILPRNGTDTDAAHHRAGAFTELVLAHITEELSEGQHVIEELLLQGA